MDLNFDTISGEFLFLDHFHLISIKGDFARHHIQTRETLSLLLKNYNAVGRTTLTYFIPIEIDSQKQNVLNVIQMQRLKTI